MAGKRGVSVAVFNIHHTHTHTTHTTHHFVVIFWSMRMARVHSSMIPRGEKGERPPVQGV